MLATCTLLLFSLAGLRAQHNTEYKFRQQSVTDGQAFNNNLDPLPVLSMNCLAANGYGQWTISTSAGQGGDGSGAISYPKGWYLLPNGLYAPSTHYDGSDLADHPGCIPPGVVQNNIFDTTQYEVEVTANLNGTVCYVWPDTASRDQFVVQQFTVSDMDISLSFCSNPTPPMNVITHPIHKFFVPTGSGCGCMTPPCRHDVISVSPSVDEFSVASDAHFLYIVWTTITNPCISGTTQVWATVIDLTTNTPVTGWPQQLGPGSRPTVACDVRNNPTNAKFEVAWISNTITPAIQRVTCSGGSPGSPFSLSLNYTNPVSGSTSSTYNKPLHARVLVSSAPSTTAIVAVYAIVDMDGSGINNALMYYRPSTSSTATSPATYVEGMLMLSEPSPITAPGSVVNNPIVACVNPYDFTDHHDAGSLPDQFHCLYQLSGAGSNPLIIIEGADNGATHPGSTTDTRLVLNQDASGDLLDDPASYVAAINQMGIHVHWRTAANVHFYSRDTSRAFDENVEENTLATDICTVTDGTGHGGTVGAMILQNRTMAIWTDPNYAFSLTNPNYGLWQPRFLGQYTPSAISANIDTHVGMLNFVGDNVLLTVGEASGVAGTPANLTDVPYFYFNFRGDDYGTTEDQGVVVNGTWNYRGLDAVHDPTYSYSTLIGTPFTCTAGLQSDDGPYGIPAECGGGSITIATFTDNESTDHPGTLIVHGGANFFCGEWTSFTITPDENNISGNIDVLYEPSVFPIYNSTYYIDDTTGSLTLDGKTLLERHAATTDTGTSWTNGGNMRGHVPLSTGGVWWDPNHHNYTGREVILNVGEVWDAVDHSGDPTHLAFDAENFTFYNTNGTSNNGTSELKIGVYDPLYTAPDDGDGGDIKFNGGLADAVEIHMVDPNNEGKSGMTIATRNYTVEHMTFNDLRAFGILVEDDQVPNYVYTYGLIKIADNNFVSFDPNVGKPFGFPLDLTGDPTEDKPVFGIYLTNLNEEGYSESGVAGQVDVTGNQFVTSNCNTTVDDDDAQNAAIVIDNTTANVENNVIEDHGYTTGILVSPTFAYSAPTTNSFSLICSNTIEHLLTEVCGPGSVLFQGISSTRSAGYVKLNTITDNDIGYFSIDHDNPKLIFNTIGDGTNDNSHFGIEIQDHSNVDMTGVHGATSGSDDYAAFNTVRGPSSDLNTPPADPVLIFLPDMPATSDVFVGNLSFTFSWANFGDNNLFVEPTSCFGSAFPIIGTFGAMNLFNIDNNFWGFVCTDLVNPFAFGTSLCNNCDWNASSYYDAQAVHIGSSLSFTTTVNALGKMTSFSGVTCGTGWGQAVANKDPKNNGLKISNVTDDSASCLKSYFEGYGLVSAQAWQAGFDTLQQFIEKCANTNPWAADAFDDIGTAFAQLGDSPSQRASYLAWLESVLYLNTTDQGYFCSDVEQMAGVLPLPHDTTPGAASRATNYTLAVIQWVIQHTTCDTPYLWQEYQRSRQQQYEQWQNNPTYYKLDTTLPPLDSIQPGLLELLEKHLLNATVSGTPPSILSEATANPNPTGDGTIITFSIAKEAYAKINVFDILGNAVSTPGYEGLFEPGNHEVPLSLQGLPSGTYFARILTAYGNVATVKLVKEQ